MTDRPILRFLEPTDAVRKKRDGPGGKRKPGGPGRDKQAERFGGAFQRIDAALKEDEPTVALRQDPSGIAPERALVFETAAHIADFAKVARAAGLEVLGEYDLDALVDADDLYDTTDGAGLEPVLYATMPTEGAFREMLRLWKLYQTTQKAPRGLAPWWAMFELLYALRPWGPDDRFTESARTEVLKRLPFDDEEEAYLELEIWPSQRADQRDRWRDETQAKVLALGGRVLDRSSIASDGFTYEALLVGLTAGTIRDLINNHHDLDGLANVDGLQFILPQTLAQSAPIQKDGAATDGGARAFAPYDGEVPVRALLLDGVPTAAHPALVGGVTIEDVHDLVDRSLVVERYHATAVASLILRGDLEADGVPLADSRLMAIPLLVDKEGGAQSPDDKLFVDLLHTALVRAFEGEEPLAPDVFVINFSIGVRHMRFANRISALARLIDWWAWKSGVLFVVSAGNIEEPVTLRNMTPMVFEDSVADKRRSHVRGALAEQAYGRTLLAPAEALNALTVGATSADLAPTNPIPITGVMRLDDNDAPGVQITSAVGLGPARAIKPDILHCGGASEVRVLPHGDDALLTVLAASQRTGLVTAEPQGGARRSRGTSNAAALTTRALLQAASSLVEEDGPYQGLELPRRDLALLTRALAVNAAIWPEESDAFFADALKRYGDKKHTAGKMDVARYFGYGVLEAQRMVESPSGGVTLVGLGDVWRDGGKVFDVCLPPSLSGEKLPRALRVTLAWFSPVDPIRATYRLAKLSAIAAGAGETQKDDGWALKLKGVGPDANMAARGSVWSRRLVTDRQSTPAYGKGAAIPVRVQCQETAKDALSPDDDIRFAIAVSLEVEAETQFDVLDEVKEEIAVRVRRDG